MYPTALQPPLLNPVYQVLLIWVIPVVNNEGLEPRSSLSLNPVLEDEAQDAASHLEKQEDGQEDGISCQEGSVLPQGTHTPSEANDEGDGATPDEDEGWVQGYVGQLGQVVEGVLLRPGPNSNGQDGKTQ